MHISMEGPNTMDTWSQKKKGLTRNRKNDGFRLFVFVGKLQAEGPRGNCWRRFPGWEPRCRVLKPTLSVARAYDTSKWLKRVDGEKTCTSWYDKCLSIFEGFRDPKWCRILVNPQQHVGLGWGCMGEKRRCYKNAWLTATAHFGGRIFEFTPKHDELIWDM